MSEINAPATRPGAQLSVTALALAAGLAIAWIDSRPKWDDTGVTAGLILVAAALGGLLGLRPWIAALLITAPLVMAELRSAGIGLLVAPLIASFAAYGGALGRRMRGQGSTL